MKKTDTRAFVPPLPLARPTASRAQAFRATALREVRRRPPTVVRPGMFVSPLLIATYGESRCLYL